MSDPAGGAAPVSDVDEECRQILMQAQAVQDQSLASTDRALQRLHEATSSGMATGEELLRQGEKLELIEKSADEISQDLAKTQRNINKLNSWTFGGVKNHFFNKKVKKEQAKTEEDLHKAERSKEKKRHHLRNTIQGGVSHSGGSGAERSTQQVADQTTHADMLGVINQNEHAIDSRLDDMTAALENLKGISTAMGSEIDNQNDQIARVQTKFEKVDTKIQHEDKQLRKLL